MMHGNPNIKYQWTLHKYSTSDHIIPNTLFRIILTSYVT